MHIVDDGRKGRAKAIQITLYVSERPKELEQVAPIEVDKVLIEGLATVDGYRELVKKDVDRRTVSIGPFGVRKEEEAVDGELLGRREGHRLVYDLFDERGVSVELVFEKRSEDEFVKAEH